jgi:mono/diheme cytochrome c family protein
LRNRSRAAAVSGLIGLALAAGLAGCRGTEIEDALGKVSWFSNMRNQPAVEPFEEPARMPPEGTVAVDAGVPLGASPDDYDGVPNPAPASEASLERGKELYGVYCSLCHGAEGRGGGSVEGPFPRGLINQLVTPRAQQLSDGYLFGMMSTGRGLMPNYRRIPQEDRWHIVNYVRQLQRAAEAEPEQ